jgi:uncharacterized protein (DUF169 family)
MSRRIREFESFAAAVDALDAAVDLRREPVGIKVIRSQAEFDAFDAPEPHAAAYYCAFVKLASRGRRYKLAAHHFLCGAASHHLGVTPIADEVARADEYVACSLYADAATAAEALSGVASLPVGVVGVVVAPLASYSAEEKPDVALIVAPTYSAMRMTQGYAFHRPGGARMQALGMHGICGESTAAPMVTSTLGVSLLCSGTRFMAKWDDDEVAVSLPAEQFAELVDGVLATLNACEPDAKKAALVEWAGERLAALDVEIGTGEGYFYEV